MTDNLDELIAEARSLSTYEGSTLERAADALEQVRRSADEWWKQYDAERQRAERAEATLAKMRGWAERVGKWAYDSPAAARVLAILDESPTERETTVAEQGLDLSTPKIPADCSCVTCLNARGADIWFMVVCATCGNKRCPHAENHHNPCTGSNEPGQPGATRYQLTEKGDGS